MPDHPRIDWSSEFVVLDVNAPVTELLLLLTDDGPYYILLRRTPDLLYVFVAGELARMPGIRQFRFVAPQAGATIIDQLDLHEPDSSHLSGPDGVPKRHPYEAMPSRKSQPSRARFVALDAKGRPIAVGEDTANLALGGDRQPKLVDLVLLSHVTGGDRTADGAKSPRKEGTKEKDAESSSSSEKGVAERRWLNAGIPGHAAEAPLSLGHNYVLEFRVDLKKSGDASTRVPDSNVLFAPDEHLVKLTVQLESDTFEIIQTALVIHLPRTGPSIDSARFDIAPAKPGRGTLIATVTKDGNYLLQMEISYSVGANDPKPVSTVVRGRPVGAAVNLRPRHLSLNIRPRRGNDYGYDCTVAGSFYMPVTLPITEFQLTDAIDYVRNAILSVVRQVDEKGRFVFQVGPPNDETNPDIDAASEQTALRVLARAGALLFNTIFYGSEAARDVTDIGDWVRERASDPTIILKLQIVSQGFPVPWGLLYVGDIADNAPLSWDLFLGMRHVIDLIPRRSSPKADDVLIVSDMPSLAVSVNVHSGIDAKWKTKVIAPQLDFWTKSEDTLKPRLRVARRLTRTDLLSALVKGIDDQLIYLYCHAVTSGRHDPGGINGSYLLLTGGERLTLADLKVEVPRTESLRGNPLVFINACESAELTPAFYDGFVPYFMEKGARGVVGTECKTPALFAAEWALRFFPRFLAGEPIGQLFLDLRQEFCREHRNPLGLLYAVYCDADTQIDPGLAV